MMAFKYGLQITPASEELLMDKASLNIQTGNDDLAMNDLNDILTLNPNHAEALFFRAYLYASQRLNAKARSDYERLVTLQPQNRQARLGLAILCDNDKRPQEAMEHIDILLRYWPNDAAVYAIRGGMYQKRRQYEQALSDMNHAIELDPKNPDFFISRALLYKDFRKTSLATADFRKAIELGASAEECASMMLEADDNAKTNKGRINLFPYDFLHNVWYLQKMYYLCNPIICYKKAFARNETEIYLLSVSNRTDTAQSNPLYNRNNACAGQNVHAAVTTGSILVHTDSVVQIVQDNAIHVPGTLPGGIQHRTQLPVWQRSHCRGHVAEPDNQQSGRDGRNAVTDLSCCGGSSSNICSYYCTCGNKDTQALFLLKKIHQGTILHGNGYSADFPTLVVHGRPCRKMDSPGGSFPGKRMLQSASGHGTPGAE
jgi:Flp pilus assembly protein TadD